MGGYAEHVLRIGRDLSMFIYKPCWYTYVAFACKPPPPPDFVSNTKRHVTEDLIPWYTGNRYIPTVYYTALRTYLVVYSRYT